jgi:Major Facilitator Superfamily
VYAIVKAAEWGWGSARTIGLGAAAIALLIGFLRAEATVRSPLIPLRIFRSRTRSVANGTRALFAVGLFGTFFMGALYLQHVLGYSAIRTGLSFLPLNIPVALFSVGITARVMARIGAKATLIPGMALASVAMLLFSRMPVHGSYLADVLPGMLVFGVGAGLSFAPGVSLSMAEAGPTESGVASGLANVTLQLGAALGLAVLASVSTLRTSHALAGGASNAAALTSGYHVAFLIAAGCVALAVVLAATLLGPSTPAESAEAPPGPRMRAPAAS